MKALTKPASFKDSQTACRDLHSGAHLAIPRNAAEQKMLLSLTSGDFWIGVVRAEQGKPGFVDVNGGVLVWEDWNVGEPNNAGGDEDCTEVWRNDNWNDQGCSDEREAICQITIGRHMFFPSLFKISFNIKLCQSVGLSVCQIILRTISKVIMHHKLTLF